MLEIIIMWYIEVKKSKSEGGMSINVDFKSKSELMGYMQDNHLDTRGFKSVETTKDGRTYIVLGKDESKFITAFKIALYAIASIFSKACKNLFLESKAVWNDKMTVYKLSCPEDIMIKKPLEQDEKQVDSKLTQNTIIFETVSEEDLNRMDEPQKIEPVNGKIGHFELSNIQSFKLTGVEECYPERYECEITMNTGNVEECILMKNEFRAFLDHLPAEKLINIGVRAKASIVNN